jgi:hypothetical protein
MKLCRIDRRVTQASDLAGITNTAGMAHANIVKAGLRFVPVNR